MPSARQVLALQARGERCVSLLADGADTGRHADTLAFCLHDLCHLEKFAQPEHYPGQVGFFSSLESALEHAPWNAIDNGFDAAWRTDRDYVLADMNGSPIFLFAALKMKLKMAVRRKCRTDGAFASGALDSSENAAFLEVFDVLLDAMQMTGDLRASAHSISAKRDAREDALKLDAYFRELGRRVLAPS